VYLHNRVKLFFRNFLAIDDSLKQTLVRLRDDLADEKSPVTRMTLFVQDLDKVKGE